MTNAGDDCFKCVQPVLGHVLIAVAQSFNSRGSRRLSAVGQIIPRVADLEDVAFDLHTADVTESLLCQSFAGGLHD